MKKIKYLRYFLGLILVAVAFFVVYPQFKSTFFQVPDLLKKADKPLILVLFALQLLTYFSDGLLTKILLKIAGFRIPLVKTFKISVVDTLANLTLPLIGGQIIKYYFFKKLKVSVPAILFLITSWTMFFYLMALGFFVVSIFFIPQSETLLPLNVIFILLVLSMFAIYFLVKKGNRIMISFLDFLIKIGNKLSLKFRKKEFVPKSRMREFSLSWEKTFNALRASKKEFFFALGIAFLYYLFDILTIYFSFLVFGFRPGIFLVIFGFTISSFLSFLTAIPYVPGVMESSLAIVFVKLGFPANVSLLAALLFRIFSYWLPMPFGLASYLDFRRDSKKSGNFEEKKL
jgi:glycosyltransferase 2 family protein